MNMHCEKCCDNHKQNWGGNTPSSTLSSNTWYNITGTQDSFKVYTLNVTSSGDPSFTYNISGMNDDNCPCECHDVCMGCDCE